MSKIDNFSVLSNQESKEWVEQLGIAFTKLPESFKTKNYSQEERNKNQHHFYISVMFETQNTQWTFDVGAMERFHKIGCDNLPCYGNCVRNIPVQDIQKQCEVIWCVSHENVNGYVEDITRVQYGRELIWAFKLFLDKYQNKSEPQLICYNDFGRSVSFVDEVECFSE